MTRMRVTAERQTERVYANFGTELVAVNSCLVWSADCPHCGDRAGSIDLRDVHRWATWHSVFCATQGLIA